MNEMKAYRMRICGRNTITAPTPAMAPSAIMSFSGPSGMADFTKSHNAPTPASIQSIGYCPSVNVTSNII